MTGFSANMLCLGKLEPILPRSHSTRSGRPPPEKNVYVCAKRADVTDAAAGWKYGRIERGGGGGGGKITKAHSSFSLPFKIAVAVSCT